MIEHLMVILVIYWRVHSSYDHCMHCMMVSTLFHSIIPLDSSPVVFRRAATERSERLSERLRPHGTYGTLALESTFGQAEMANENSTPVSNS